MRPDRIGNADMKNVAHATFALIDAVQDYEQEEALVALAVVFRTACERYKLHPADLLVVANNITYDGEIKRPEFKAVTAFMKHEWHD